VLIDRAQGCVLGQLAGDALGSLVEFRTPGEIRRMYPAGVRELADGGTWNTMAGQPTDDSELALALARTLVEHGTYDAEAVLEAYRFWLDSGPFDCGTTTSTGLCGKPDRHSQSNGALMRVSPLGVFGANHSLERVADWARQDADLTHPNPVCQQANILFTMAIAQAVAVGPEPADLYRSVVDWAESMEVEPVVLDTVRGAADAPPADYVRQQGWVLIALRNALWQLLHASTLEQGVVNTVMRGGDTDTNAAVCGALLGAVHGLRAIPGQWIECILQFRPEVGLSGVYRPRPSCFWPVDALELAARLAGGA
jgi:ADP-ribosylglycohydrolase